MKKLMFLFLVLMFLCACDIDPTLLEVDAEPVVVDVVEEEKEFVCGEDKVKDSDGNEYKTAYFDVEGGHDVSKEGQCWMAENLNVGKIILEHEEESINDGKIEKYCLDKDKNHCDGLNGKGKFGGLYTWGETSNYADLQTSKGKVKGICPVGWHIPEYEDWLYVKNFFSQFRTGTIDGVPVRMKVRDSYGGFKLMPSYALHRTQDYFVEGITKRLYLAGIMRGEKSIFPAIFYMGDEYNYFLMRELKEATQSVRCVRNSERISDFTEGDFSVAGGLNDRVREIGDYITQKKYNRDEEILNYFVNEKLLYGLYGFENYLTEEKLKYYPDDDNSGFVNESTYIATLRQKKYENLDYDFNVGHKYFFVFEKKGNEWKIVDITSTKRSSSVGYTYIGDVVHEERKFLFLKNIFHFEELLRKTENVIQSEEELIEFLKKRGKR